MDVGKVYLVGAGPGDPGLLTLRGKELLEEADVVVYDRLIHPSLLNFAPRNSERIYVGKQSSRHALPQPEINRLLVEKAKQGLMVVRLKGGDPFVFGRGGEEAEVCLEHGIPFEIVPGITSAIAAPAYAGIPITHRDSASSFCVITGHEREDRGEASPREAGAAESRRNWARLAYAADTLLFLMGVEALPEIAARLQEHGRSPETPVAIVQWGTWPIQRVVTGTLASIEEEAEKAGITPPAVCVVGEVVRMRERLRWFDNPINRPLLGKRVVVTRAREQAGALTELLRQEGAETIEFPTIRIVPIAENPEIEHAIRHLSDYDWIVFTSTNTVPVIKEKMQALGKDARSFGSARIAAIGPATAESLLQHLGLIADFFPSEAVAEEVIAQWPDPEMTGKRVLIPRAKEARELLPERLMEMGAAVEVIPVYETVHDSEPTEALKEMLVRKEIDAITFTASSTVRNFINALSDKKESAGCSSSIKELLGNTMLAAIGPVTAKTLAEYGLEAGLTAPEHTIKGLADALKDWYAREKPDG